MPLLAGGPPPKCTDVATQWTLSDYYTDGTTVNAIRSDGSGPYASGQSGVTATIQICNGTNDAVLSTGSSRRLSFDFTKVLATNTKTPSWASGIRRPAEELHARNGKRCECKSCGGNRSKLSSFSTSVDDRGGTMDDARVECLYGTYTNDSQWVTLYKWTVVLAANLNGVEFTFESSKDIGDSSRRKKRAARSSY